MAQILKELSLPDHYLLYLSEAIEKKLLAEKGQHDNILAAEKRQLSGLQQRVDSLEEKYISDKLDPETYFKWKARYQSEMSIIKKNITDASRPVDELLQFFRKTLPMLGNLHWHYEQADLHTKQAILRAVFNSQLYYHDGIYRTPYILPAFALKAATLNEKRLLIIEQPLKISSKVEGCAPNLPSLEHLTPLLHLLNQIKTA